MDHRELTIERERCLQFFQSLRRLSLLVIGLAQDNMKLGTITTDDNHLFDYLVGFFYFRQRWYPGAVDRFQTVLKDDPEYTRRDEVYFHLGESFVKIKREAEALPYFERLVSEFQQSEYLEEAKKRIAELKATMAAKATASQ